MINSTLFDSLIPIGSFIRPCIGGFEGSYSSDFSNGVAFVFSDDVLDVLDPRLGAAIRWYAEDSLVVPGSYVTSMLLLWDAEVFVKDATARSVGVYDVEHVRIDDGNLIIDGSAYSYAEVLIAGYPEKIKLPDILSLSEVVVNKQWLDQYYPSWDKRLITGLELGVLPMETLCAALSINRTIDVGVLPNDLLRPE